MTTDLARNWWLLALRGIAGILFGIAAFVWPDSTLEALVLVFGAYVFVDGIFAVVTGIGMRRQLRFWWLVLLEGVAGIALGVLIFRSPDITALILLSFLAVWSVITGIFKVATAVRLQKLIPNEWLLGLSGVASLIFGALLIALPDAGLLAVVWLLGSYGLLFGILTLLVSFRLRSRREMQGRQAAGVI